MSAAITNDRLPCFVNGGEKLENPALARNKQELYQIAARNFLRHFTYGTDFFYEKFLTITNLKLCWYIFKALIVKKDIELLDVIREELKKIFLNISLYCEKLNPTLQNRLEVFINTLVSNFAFLDPKEGEEVVLPQKIHGAWLKVTYQFKKIDISSKAGWRAKLLEAEDRIYAYGLEPALPEAYPYLLLMGTTYLTGQGAFLSLLSIVTPGLSVGESHDLTELEKWMCCRLKVKVCGHSQGGTMAMLVTIRYSKHTHSAYCLNPAILHKETLLRLKPLGGEKINVYVQERDPVFMFGDLLIKGTRVFHVTQPNAKKYSRLSAHALHFSGYPEASITEIKTENISSNTRKFFNDFKYLADRIVNPLLNVKFIISILLRKFGRFYRQHKTIFQVLLFCSLVLTNITLMLIGILTPDALGFIYLHSVAAYLILALGAFIASAIATYFIPKIVNFTNKLLAVFLSVGGFFIASVALLLGLGCAALLLLARITSKALS